MHTLAISRFYLPGEAQFPLNGMFTRPANRQEEGQYNKLLEWSIYKISVKPYCLIWVYLQESTLVTSNYTVQKRAKMFYNNSGKMPREVVSLHQQSSSDCGI